MMSRFSVPANVLIAGEYLITRAGGTGVALATAPRAVCTITDAESRETGKTPSSAKFHRALRVCGDATEPVVPPLAVQAITTHRESCAPPLVNTVCREVARLLTAGSPGDWHVPEHLVPEYYGVTIDTSAFYDPQSQQKTGFGSSAAASVLLTAAVLDLAGFDPLRYREETIRISLAAHRELQGGRGSGYDLVTSTVGGLIRFEGAAPPETPRWSSPRENQLLPGRGVRIFTWSTGRTVHSGRAVEAFDRVYPPGAAAQDLLVRNNAATATLCLARDWDTFCTALEEAGSLSREIGTRIGFEADLPGVRRYRDAEWVIKASGAGNERGLLFTTPNQRPHEILRRAGVSARDRESLRELFPEWVGLSAGETTEEG